MPKVITPNVYGGSVIPKKLQIQRYALKKTTDAFEWSPDDTNYKMMLRYITYLKHYREVRLGYPAAKALPAPADVHDLVSSLTPEGRLNAIWELLTATVCDAHDFTTNLESVLKTKKHVLADILQWNTRK